MVALEMPPEITASFVAEARSYLPQIAEALAAVEDRTLLAEAYRFAHTIKSSAAMMGHEGLSQLAELLEADLEGFQYGELAEPAHLAQLGRSLGRIGRLLNAVAGEAVDIDLVLAEEVADRVAVQDGGAAASDGLPAATVPAMEDLLPDAGLELGQHDLLDQLAGGLPVAFHEPGESGEFDDAEAPPLAAGTAAAVPATPPLSPSETHTPPLMATTLPPTLELPASADLPQPTVDDEAAEARPLTRRATLPTSAPVPAPVADLQGLPAADPAAIEAAPAEAPAGDGTQLSQLPDPSLTQAGSGDDHSTDDQAAAPAVFPAPIDLLGSAPAAPAAPAAEPPDALVALADELAESALALDRDLGRGLDLRHHRDGVVDWLRRFDTAAASASPVPTAEAIELDPAAGEEAALRRTLEAELRFQVEEEVRAKLAVEQRSAPRSSHIVSLADWRAPALRPAPAPAASAATPAPAGLVLDDSVDPELREVFLLEAGEHLKRIGDDVAALDGDPGNRERLRSLRRSVHTLKGAAAMMGFDAVASLAHTIEDRLDLATADGAEVDPAAYATLLEDIDRLERLVRGDIPAAAAAPGAGPVAAAAEPADHAGAAAAGAPEPQAAAATAPGGAAPAAVPVRLDLLDELLRLAGESSITVAAWQPVLATAGSATAELRRLIVRLRAVTEDLATRRSEEDTLAGSRRAATARLNSEPGEFDPLELDRYTTTDYIAHELAEIGAESHSVEREIASALDTAAELTTAERHHTSALQDRLLDARLVPLDDLATRLQRAARGVALRRGKDVDFVFEGGKVGVDRALVDSVADALIHLVRNAVDHGIELPEVRRARGKPAAGAVRIVARHEQGEAVIEVADDGAGIDARAVAAAARARGEEIPEEDALAAVFRPGFTTAAQVDDVSGRGIGLDAVRDAIRRIRGTVEVATEVGRGTVFSLRFPVTLAQARVVLAVAAGHPVAVPAPAIRRVVRLADVQTERFGDQPIARLDGQGYEVTQLASLLALPPSPLPANPPVLFVEAAGKRAALVADSVGTQQEVVVKGTGTHLGALRGVAGATLMQNGRVALLLHLPDLLGSAGIHTRALTEPAGEAPRAPAPPSAPVAGHRALRVLVVDDSPTIRKLLVRMLKDLGWQPAEAKDGDEALEAIRLDRPDAVLADVEMPRLDGYGLLARLRERPETADLPVVMLTSRTAERHRQRARDLGANGYLTKPYRPADVVAALTAVCPEVPAAGMGVA